MGENTKANCRDAMILECSGMYWTGQKYVLILNKAHIVAVLSKLCRVQLGIFHQLCH